MAEDDAHDALKGHMRIIHVQPDAHHVKPLDTRQECSTLVLKRIGSSGTCCCSA